jgi:hypothetical protein
VVDSLLTMLLQGVPNGDFEFSSARRVLPSLLNAHSIAGKLIRAITKLILAGDYLRYL